MDDVYFNDFAVVGLIERLRKATHPLSLTMVREVADALAERNAKVIAFSGELRWAKRERDELQSKLDKLIAENEWLRQELEAIKK